MTNPDYKVADMSLAAFGHAEISLAEAEMPALMKLREKYAKEQPSRTPASWVAST